MIEQIVTVVVGVGLGSLLGSWLGSKFLARNLVSAVQRVAENEELRVILNERAEEVGASFVRGARIMVRSGINPRNIPVPEMEDFA